MEFVKPGSRYEFVNKTRFFGGLSVVVVALCLVILLVRGLNFGTDFQGGTEMVFRFDDRPALEELRAAVATLPYEGASIQTFGAENQIMIRVRQVSSLSEELVGSMDASVRARYGDRLEKFEVNRAGGLITVVLSKEAQEATAAAKEPPAKESGDPAKTKLAPGQVQTVTVNPDGTRTVEGYIEVDHSKKQGLPKTLDFSASENSGGTPAPESANPGGVPPKDRLVLAQTAPSPGDAKTEGDGKKKWPMQLMAPKPDDEEMFEEERERAISMNELKKRKANAEAVSQAKTTGDQRAALSAQFKALGITVVGDAQRYPSEAKTEYRIGFAGVAAEVGDALAVKFPKSGVEPNAIYYVGPQVGEQLRNEGILSVVYALLGILIYIVLRFNFTFAPGAIIALVHDVLITVGIFSLFQLKFDLPIIAALLTIVGYSLNDTIVVYDRIREELAKIGEGKEPLSVTVDRALNACISRTILTSVTTLIVVVILWAFGGPTIREFSIAMTIGVIVGTYSSMFVASPVYLFLVHWWEQRQEALDLEAA